MRQNQIMIKPVDELRRLDQNGKPGVCGFVRMCCIACLIDHHFARIADSQWEKKEKEEEAAKTLF